MRSRRFDSRMAWACWRPQGEWRAAMIGRPPPLCSTRPPRNHGRPAPAAASRVRSSWTMASSCTWVTERPLCGCRRRFGKCPTTIVWKCTIRYLPSAGCSSPERRRRRGVSMAPARHDDQLGFPGVRDPVRPHELDAGGPPALGDDAAHVGLGHQLGPPRGHGPGQQRHRVALGVDGAAEEGAEAAVVAGRPPVVGDAVGRRRRLVGVQADLLGGGRRQHGAVHRRPGGHRVGAGPPGGERVGALAARDADGPLDLGVVRLELVVVERPVVDRGALLRAVGGEEPEVLLPEARHLAVGVGPAAPDRRRDGVHLADVRVLALVRRAAEGPRLDERVGPEEVARDELDLVVGVVARRLGQVVGVEQMVAALLHDDDGPARPGSAPRPPWRPRGRSR